MAKKFGKFLLFTAAVGTAAAAVHYYLQKKKAENTESEDEDYDDFSDESKNYVPLTPETKTDENSSEEKTEPADEGFTPLKDTVEDASEKADDAAHDVEEFFDEEDDSDEEPAINDN